MRYPASIWSVSIKLALATSGRANEDMFDPKMAYLLPVCGLCWFEIPPDHAITHSNAAQKGGELKDMVSVRRLSVSARGPFQRKFRKRTVVSPLASPNEQVENSRGARNVAKFVLNMCGKGVEAGLDLRQEKFFEVKTDFFAIFRFWPFPGS